jgi:hypothetical protein
MRDDSRRGDFERQGDRIAASVGGCARGDLPNAGRRRYKRHAEAGLPLRREVERCLVRIDSGLRRHAQECFGDRRALRNVADVDGHAGAVARIHAHRRLQPGLDRQARLQGRFDLGEIIASGIAPRDRAPAREVVRSNELHRTRFAGREHDVVAPQRGLGEVHADACRHLGPRRGVRRRRACRLRRWKTVVLRRLPGFGLFDRCAGHYH